MLLVLADWASQHVKGFAVFNYLTFRHDFGQHLGLGALR